MEEFRVFFNCVNLIKKYLDYVPSLVADPERYSFDVLEVFDDVHQAHFNPDAPIGQTEQPNM